MRVRNRDYRPKPVVVVVKNKEMAIYITSHAQLKKRRIFSMGMYWLNVKGSLEINDKVLLPPCCSPLQNLPHLQMENGCFHKRFSFGKVIIFLVKRNGCLPGMAVNLLEAMLCRIVFTKGHHG